MKHKCEKCSAQLSPLKVEEGMLSLTDPKTPRLYCKNCDKVYKIELTEEG